MARLLRNRDGGVVREAKMAVLFSVFVEAKNGGWNKGANLSTDPTTPREDVLSR